MNKNKSLLPRIRNRIVKRVRWLIKKSTQPQYIPAGVSVTEFIDKVNRSGSRYAVLRWFEELPGVSPGEDIDVLVSDNSVATVLSFLVPLISKKCTPSCIKCDLKSVSGSYRPWLKYVAYYPPFFAEQILERAVRHRSGAMVPCDEDHFLSLAYHAVYHKGLSSGLPLASGEFRPESNPEHDYLAVLKALAARIGFQGTIEMDALDEALSARGLCPPLDIKPDHMPKDDWFRRRMERLYVNIPVIDGLTVFVLRERAVEVGLQNEFVRLAERAGFSILAIEQLSDIVRQRASWYIRGSNWGVGGKLPVAGGGPAFAIAALDLTPALPDDELLRKQPELDNARAFRFKLQVRQAWNDARPLDEHSNVIHSSDNARQAIMYMRTLMPESVEQVVAKARACAKSSLHRNLEPINLVR